MESQKGELGDESKRGRLVLILDISRTTRVASTVQSSTSQAIEHGYGQEAKSLLESAGNTSADVGKSVGNAAHSTISSCFVI